MLKGLCSLRNLRTCSWIIRSSLEKSKFMDGLFLFYSLFNNFLTTFFNKPF